MQRGRKPTPTALKVIRGNPGRRPLNRDEPMFQAGDLVPPAHLDGHALREWHRVLESMPPGLVTDGDVAALAAYCNAYSRWVAAEEKLREMAERDPVMGGLMIRTQGGNVIQNPLVGMANRAMDQMVKFATEFGMTPSARSRVSAPAQTDDNPFLRHGKRGA